MQRTMSLISLNFGNVCAEALNWSLKYGQNISNMHNIS